MANCTRSLSNQSEAEMHRGSLLHKLVSLRENKELCDVTIIVENKEFHAHKNILSASSDYFRTMFTSEFQEKNLDEIELDGTSASFERMLGFAYSGNLELEELSTPDAIDMLNMAAYLQLKHAVKLISQCLLRAIECGFADLVEIYRIWELSDLLSKGMDIEELAATALDFLSKQFIQFSQLEFFKSNVSVEFFKNCLQKNNLAGTFPETVDEGKKESKVEKEDMATSGGEEVKMNGKVAGLEDEVLDENSRREEEIVGIVMLWLSHDWQSRQVYAFSLLQAIRLSFLSSNKISELLDSALGKITDCRQLLESRSGFSRPRGNIKVPVLMRPDSVVHIYSRKLGQWREVFQNFTPKPFEDLSRYSCLAIGNHLYICGGISNLGVTGRSFCRYHLDDDQKQLVLSNMRYPRCDCTMVQLDHHIYVIGGVDSQTADVDQETKQVERYDTNLVRYDSSLLEDRNIPWATLSAIPGSCWRPHGVAYKGKILCCGLSERPPIIRRAVQDDETEIEYVLYIYDPDSDRWQMCVLQERHIVHCMRGKQNFVKLLVHKGECFLVGTIEVPSERNPTVPWFRLTINKLMFEEEGSHLRFVRVGESLDQDLMDNEHFTAFFYIGDDVFYKWGNNMLQVPGVKMTDSDLKEKLDTYNGIPNSMSQSVALAEVDIKYLENDCP